MPQLDKITYSSQIFWCLITFSTIYVVLLRNVLPNIAKILKIRKKLINNYEDILNSLKKEKKENIVSNMYANVISTSKDSLESVVKSYDIHTENINNYNLSILLKIIQNVKLS